MSDRASLRAEFERGAKIQSEMAFQGKTIAVRTDRIEMAGLPPQRWDIVLHPGAVVIVPVADDGKIVLIKQWRRAISEITVELPAGTLDQKNEEVAKCAQRELQEEIGFRAEEIIPLGGFYSAPGFCNEFLHLFIGKSLKPDPLPHDVDEAIDLYPVSLDEAFKLIDDGTIHDAKTVAGIFRYERWLKQTHGQKKY